MEKEDFKVLSSMGRALWADPLRSSRAALETLTAVSLQPIAREKVLERTTGALLLRAEREGVGATTTRLNEPFFRLSAQERFVLVALHSGHWSYRRLARVLGKSPDQIAELAWKARVALALNLVQRKGKTFPIPSGGDGPRCPQFDSRKPWMQSFLDEEVPAQERLFLQNHLMVCDSCRHSLMRTRDIYFLVDSEVPIESEESEVERMQSQWEKMYRMSHLNELTFKESLQVFLARESTRWMLSSFALVFLLYLVAQSF